MDGHHSHLLIPQSSGRSFRRHLSLIPGTHRDYAGDELVSTRIPLGSSTIVF